MSIILPQRVAKLCIFLLVMANFSNSLALQAQCLEIFQQNKASKLAPNHLEDSLKDMGLSLKHGKDIVPLEGVEPSSEAIVIKAISEMTSMRFVVDSNSKNDEIRGVDLQIFLVPRHLLEERDRLLAELSDLQSRVIKWNKLEKLGININGVVLTSKRFDFDVLWIDQLRVFPEIAAMVEQMIKDKTTLTFSEKLQQDNFLGASFKNVAYLLTKYLFPKNSILLSEEGIKVLEHELVHTRKYIEHLSEGRPLIGFTPYRGETHPEFPIGYRQYFRADELEAWSKTGNPSRVQEFLKQRRWLELAKEELQKQERTLFDILYEQGSYQVKIILSSENVIVRVYLPKRFTEDVELDEFVKQSVDQRLEEVIAIQNRVHE